MPQRLNTTKTKETDSLDHVEKMAYKVNEIVLTAKETIWPLRMRMNQTFLSSNIMKQIKRTTKIKASMKIK